ncbi:hypothetical protein ACB094_09G008600 [Castanea mollissima]
MICILINLKLLVLLLMLGKSRKKMVCFNYKSNFLKIFWGVINIKMSDVHQGVNIIKNRLCHKKVLLVLDDVNHVHQLEKLAGEHHWFGLGSRIIITTRDEHVLVAHRVRKIYRPK